MTINKANLTSNPWVDDLAKTFITEGSALNPAEARRKAIEYIRETIEYF